MKDVRLFDTDPVGLGSVTANDLRYADGDLLVEPSTQQHQRLLLITHQGDWLENEGAGVGVNDFLNDEQPDMLLREIRQQFTRDGMRISRLALRNNQIIDIEAMYI